MKIYFAGALFSLGERIFNEKLAGLLRAKGYEIFLPQEKQEGTIKDIFISDRDHIVWCDTLMAIGDNADVDSGTCWEIGYAYALEKRIVIIRTDFRILEKWGKETRPINLMMYESADNVVEYYGKKIEELVDKIDKVLTTNP